ncbi:MAG TPA: hypothetical protein VIP46_22360 [Pyrinomonadaceae bacterium]
MQIEDTDFQPLDEFPLKWRWTDSRWNELPADALLTIQPVAESKARELLQYSLTFSDASGLFETQFEQISRVEAPANSPSVREWLLARSTDPNQMVIVSWDHHHAALVRWAVFCEYWDDFCYPASDDVTVWPPSEEWVLMYLHDEEFVFGKRRGSGAA